MQGVVDTLEKARARLLETASSVADESRVRMALGRAVPQLPGIIAQHVPDADAKIFTRDQLRELLALIAAEALSVQMECLVAELCEVRRAED